IDRDDAGIGRDLEPGRQWFRELAEGNGHLAVVRRRISTSADHAMPDCQRAWIDDLTNIVAGLLPAPPRCSAGMCLEIDGFATAGAPAGAIVAEPVEFLLVACPAQIAHVRLEFAPLLIEPAAFLVEALELALAVVVEGEVPAGR